MEGPVGTRRVAATPIGDRWVAATHLVPGEPAVVLPGDLVDANGEVKGSLITLLAP